MATVSTQATIASCKICMEESNDEMNPLISPCSCSGTVAYVHKDCIVRWITMNNSNNPGNPISMSICSVCHDILQCSMIGAFEEKVSPLCELFFVARCYVLCLLCIKTTIQFYDTSTNMFERYMWFVANWPCVVSWIFVAACDIQIVYMTLHGVRKWREYLAHYPRNKLITITIGYIASFCMYPAISYPYIIVSVVSMIWAAGIHRKIRERFDCVRTWTVRALPRGTVVPMQQPFRSPHELADPILVFV